AGQEHGAAFPSDRKNQMGLLAQRPSDGLDITAECRLHQPVDEALGGDEVMLHHLVERFLRVAEALFDEELLPLTGHLREQLRAVGPKLGWRRSGVTIIGDSTTLHDNLL